MSNPMYLRELCLGAGGSPTTAPTAPMLSESADTTQCTLIIIGTILLLIWCVRRLRRPRKLRLLHTPGRPNSLTALHILPVFLFWQLAGAAAMYLLQKTALEESHARLLAGLIGQIVTLPLLLVVGHLTFRHGLTRGLGLSPRHWGFDSLRGLYAVLAVFPVCWGLAKLFGLLIKLLQPEWFQQHSLLVTLWNASAGWQMVVVLSAAVLAPLVEELLFRGLLQSMLRRYLSNPWHAILLTAGVFALFHFNTPQNIPALFVLAVVVGYNYERCGRLWPAILIHMLFNGITLILNLL
ncbi:MAG: CPBP family intramembrane metalloprotease [Phycisphaerae bacterium]|nr:CPBP family intramembrane metalloprotease [Phycisphaerae bacterium]